jgi:hypothetical protein
LNNEADMSKQSQQIEHINALTRNTRSTWFDLLAALVFVTITLMGVEHIDFYGVDRATKLPLVDVEVPTRYFFFAAPRLTTAIYCYFHLYLIRLWDALAAAEPTPNGRPLGPQITPWLISDAALHLRADGAAPIGNTLALAESLARMGRRSVGAWVPVVAGHDSAQYLDELDFDLLLSRRAGLRIHQLACAFGSNGKRTISRGANSQTNF